jgi:hypothetical protein
MTPSISALELQQIDTPFDHPDWIFEIKFDGFRSLAAIANGRCNLISRKANAFKRFSDLGIALPSDLKGVTDAVLDGEIVVLDERGASQFYPLMSSNSKPIYAAFDLVWLNGEDLSDLPLLERKKRLRSIVRKNASRVLYVDHIVGLGKALFSEVCNVTWKASSPSSRSTLQICSPQIAVDQDQEQELHAEGRSRRDVQPEPMNTRRSTGGVGSLISTVRIEIVNPFFFCLEGIADLLLGGRRVVSISRISSESWALVLPFRERLM